MLMNTPLRLRGPHTVLNTETDSNFPNLNQHNHQYFSSYVNFSSTSSSSDPTPLFKHQHFQLYKILTLEFESFQTETPEEIHSWLDNRMGGLPIKDTSVISLQSTKDQGATAVAPSDSKPKKICCACPDTKKLRDHCIVEHGEDACGKWIEAHRKCLRAEGFNV